MKDFKGKVAVVTGGAGGIGRAMAERFAAEGMKVLIADIAPDALTITEAEMKAKGYEVASMRVDVSKPGEIEAMAARAIELFGRVNILCNNAGVAVAGATWERTPADWDWVMGVNLMAVIHGVRVFVPIMLKQGDECHIVNTASMAGLISGPGMAIYNVTKFGVVTLSEVLYHELNMTKAKIGISVLCPGWVQTQIVDSARNRPEEKQNAEGVGAQKPGDKMLEQMVREFVKKGQTTEKVANEVFEAVRDNKFYILTHKEMKPLIKLRMEDILEERNPTFKPMM